MRLWSRSSVRVATSLVAITALAASFMIITLVRPLATHASSAGFHSTRGQLHLVGQVNVATLPHASASTAAPHALPLRLQPGSRGAAAVAAARGQAPSTLGARFSANASVLHNFNGLDAIQSEAVQPNSIDVRAT